MTEQLARYLHADQDALLRLLQERRDRKRSGQPFPERLKNIIGESPKPSLKLPTEVNDKKKETLKDPILLDEAFDVVEELYQEEAKPVDEQILLGLLEKDYDPNNPDPKQVELLARILAILEHKPKEEKIGAPGEELTNILAELLSGLAGQRTEDGQGFNLQGLKTSVNLIRRGEQEIDEGFLLDRAESAEQLTQAINDAVVLMCLGGRGTIGPAMTWLEWGERYGLDTSVVSGVLPQGMHLIERHAEAIMKLLAGTKLSDLSIEAPFANLVQEVVLGLELNTVIVLETGEKLPFKLSMREMVEWMLGNKSMEAKKDKNGRIIFSSPGIRNGVSFTYNQLTPREKEKYHKGIGLRPVFEDRTKFVASTGDYAEAGLDKIPSAPGERWMTQASNQKDQTGFSSFMESFIFPKLQRLLDEKGKTVANIKYISYDPQHLRSLSENEVRGLLTEMPKAVAPSEKYAPTHEFLKGEPVARANQLIRQTLGGFWGMPMRDVALNYITVMGATHELDWTRSSDEVSDALLKVMFLPRAETYAILDTNARALLADVLGDFFGRSLKHYPELQASKGVRRRDLLTSPLDFESANFIEKFEGMTPELERLIDYLLAADKPYPQDFDVDEGRMNMLWQATQDSDLRSRNPRTRRKAQVQLAKLRDNFESKYLKDEDRAPARAIRKKPDMYAIACCFQSLYKNEFAPFNAFDYLKSRKKIGDRFTEADKQEFSGMAGLFYVIDAHERTSVNSGVEYKGILKQREYEGNAATAAEVIAFELIPAARHSLREWETKIYRSTEEWLTRLRVTSLDDVFGQIMQMGFETMMREWGEDVGTSEIIKQIDDLTEALIHLKQAVKWPSGRDGNRYLQMVIGKIDDYMQREIMSRTHHKTDTGDTEQGARKELLEVDPNNHQMIEAFRGLGAQIVSVTQPDESVKYFVTYATQTPHIIEGGVGDYEIIDGPKKEKIRTWIAKYAGKDVGRKYGQLDINTLPILYIVLRKLMDAEVFSAEEAVIIVKELHKKPHHKDHASRKKQ